MEILQNEITRSQIKFSTNFGGKLSFIMSFLFLERLHTIAYISTAPTRTSIIITLHPCALDTKFQHFMLRFHKISLL